ncbi:MAG: hypothetical protein KKG59_04995 [Nanoarchaeota archaeon]|nr:hypothetical protein [Nanoarchaeota archaeon]
MPEVQLAHVRALKSQGLDNNQIIESLQRDGYSSSQIFDAINQVDMTSGSDLGLVSGTAMPGNPPQAPSQSFVPPPSAQSTGPPPQAPAPVFSHEMPQNVDAEYQDHAHDHSSYEVSNTEEIVEAIIDEKWNELLKDINKIIDWKNEAESKIIAMEQKFDMLKDQFDKLHQAVIGKVGEYDKHILDVGSEVKAMEKVFSKVLPAFTENVHILQKVTDKFQDKAEEK